MDSRVIEIRKHLKKKLDPMRFEHTLGVSYTCQALAMRYGYDLDKAELAGLLHDCAKNLTNEKRVDICRKKQYSNQCRRGEESFPPPCKGGKLSCTEEIRHF